MDCFTNIISGGSILATLAQLLPRPKVYQLYTLEAKLERSAKVRRIANMLDIYLKVSKFCFLTPEVRILNQISLNDIKSNNKPCFYIQGLSGWSPQFQSVSVTIFS